MPTTSAEALEQLITDVLLAADAPAQPAAIVAESLVLANLKGVDSHGVLRLPQYVDEIETGLIQPTAQPTSALQGATARIDGHRGFGQVAGREASRLACELARTHGLGLASLSSVQHVGRLGEYVERAANADCIAIAFCNTGPAGGRVVPFGGTDALFGTNPIAYAFPGQPAPLVADFSTSATAEGRVRAAQQAGTRLRDRWILNADGEPSDDPNDLYSGGAILPAGGHRGTALALLVELLGGVLGRAGTASTGDEPGNGLVLLAIEADALRPRAEFETGLGRVLDALRAAPPAPGVGRVLAPGDLELETEARRRVEGIPVPDGTWRAVVAAAARYGVALP